MTKGKTTILLMEATKYMMVNEETGAVNEALNARYIGDLEFPHEEQAFGENTVKYGTGLSDEKFPIEMAGKLVRVPGLYESNWRFENVKVTKEFNGQKSSQMYQRVKLLDLKYIGHPEIKITDITDPGAAQ